MKASLGRVIQVCILMIGLPYGVNSQAKPYLTIDNLNRAYVAEANAYNKYWKFADQADKDGYPMVARLFRSAAFSEIIHSRNHAAAIEGLGGKPQIFVLNPVKVGTTKENIEGASKDERRDEISMYETFVVQAEKDGLREAKASFKFASDSEIQHKQLFEKSLTLLGPKNLDYYVDVKSGETVEVRPGEMPPKSKLVDGMYVKAAY